MRSESLKDSSELAAGDGNRGLLYLALGRSEAARECIEHIARLEEPSGDALAPFKRRNPHWIEEMTALLRKVGWQEC